jgi:hypothetical protein
VTAEQKLQTLAAELGFDRTVSMHRSGVFVDRPARGKGPLVLALDTAVARVGSTPVSDGHEVHYGHISITHVASGMFVERITHPFTTERAPTRQWMIPATKAGVLFAERLRKTYLALDVAWDGELDTATALDAKHKVSDAEPSAKVVAKIEREAARLFHDELQHREWPGEPASKHAALVREVMISRFFWRR